MGEDKYIVGVSNRKMVRQPDTSSISSTELSFPPRWISGEMCAGLMRLGHAAQDGESDCLAAVPLLWGKNMAPGL